MHGLYLKFMQTNKKKLRIALAQTQKVPWHYFTSQSPVLYAMQSRKLC